MCICVNSVCVWCMCEWCTCMVYGICDNVYVYLYGNMCICVLSAEDQVRKVSKPQLSVS